MVDKINIKAFIVFLRTIIISIILFIGLMGSLFYSEYIITGIYLIIGVYISFYLYKLRIINKIIYSIIYKIVLIILRISNYYFLLFCIYIIIISVPYIPNQGPEAYPLAFTIASFIGAIICIINGLIDYLLLKFNF